MTLIRRVFLAGQSFPSAARTAVTKRGGSFILPRAYAAGAMLVIALTILLALIIAAVGGGSFILARRFR